MKEVIKKIFGSSSFWASIVILAYIVGFTAINSTCFVPTGHRAAKTSGKATVERSYPEGFMFKFPIWDEVYVFDCREQLYNYQVVVRSRENQRVTLIGAINYQVNGDNVHLLLKNVGDENVYREKLLTPLITDALNDVLSTYSIDYIATSRDVIKEAVIYIINDQLGSNDYIFLNQVRMYNPEFEKAIEDALRDVAKREQMLKLAIVETQIVEQEAEQMKLRLSAEAYGVKMTSDALTNPVIVKYLYGKAFNNWKGNTPNTVVVGQSTLPVMSIK